MNSNPQIAVVLDRLRSAHNTGNIFRIADAIGAKEVLCCGYTPAPPHPKLEKTAMGADKTVPCRTFPSACDAIRTLRAEGYAMVVAAECVDNSPCAWDFDYKFPLAVVFGNEALGVSSEALAECDAAVSLPMLGWKSSINVGNCAAAVLYAILANARAKGHDLKRKAS
jgi:23S rRNA (guanosine2251-2'-O)-methyltransferase